MKFLSITSVSLSFKLFCVIGLSIQVGKILTTYFEYETTSRTSMGVEDVLPMPGISVCVLYTDILDRSQSAKYSIRPTIPIADQQIIADINNLTVGDIFKLTPQANETIKKCKLRLKDSYTITIMSSKECYDAFDVKKFYMQELICYELKPKKILDYQLTRAAHSHNYVRLLWEVFLDEKFDSTDQLTLIAPISTNHKKPDLAQQSLPLYSRNFAKSMYRMGDPKSRTLVLNIFYVAHEWNRIYLKPPPYDTDCDEYLGRFACIRECMQHKLLLQNRVPFTEITVEDSLPEIGHLFPVRPIDLQDPKMERCVYQSESYCREKCNRLPCNQWFTKTLVDSFFDKRFNYSSRIRATSPASPTVDVIAVANFDFYQLVIYICSCFGVWLGVSILSLDPSKSRFVVNAFYSCYQKRQHKQVQPEDEGKESSVSE